MRTRLCPAATSAILVLFSVGCASVTVKLSDLPRMTVEPEGPLVVAVVAPGQRTCAVWIPPLRLNAIPATATQLEAQLSNPDRLGEPPKGWYVPYVSYWRPRTVLTVVDGAIALRAHGIGPTPCPPGGASRYHIEVVVRDRQDQPLAYGSRTIEVTEHPAPLPPRALCQTRGAGDRFILDCP